MCKFTEIRFRRIEAAIFSDLQQLANNIDTLIRFFECSAIAPKVAYKRAKVFAARFEILVKRLHNALDAANNNDNLHGDNRIKITHDTFVRCFHQVDTKLEYFNIF